jgi:outer membrane immunogenic protein
MRRILFTTISLLALTASGALGADLPRKGPAAPAAVINPVYNWTGFYVGINGGYGWGDSGWNGLGSSSSSSGGLVGLTLGYNWQAFGSPYVFGLEGDIDWSDIKGIFANAACPTGCETKNSWLGTVRGRLGYAVDRVMPYFTGGLAVGDVHATQVGIAGVSSTNVGWTVGAGVEYAVAGNWSAKLEYLYVDLGNVDCGACSAVTNVDFRANLVRAGVNWRF